LRWIPDVWGTATRIREAGQTIIYTTHDSATHLSIFVSAEVAGDHHRRIGSVLRTIEALPPGLYEMAVEKSSEGMAPVVHFEARETEAILALCDDPSTDFVFAQASATADWLSKGYDLMLGPWLRALTSASGARLSRQLHPMRLQNSLLSDANPVMAALAGPAEAARLERKPVDLRNPYFRFEREMTSLVARQLDLARDLREAMTELGFLAAYTHPLWRREATQPAAPRPMTAEAQADAESMALSRVTHGGYAEGVVRMCVILSRAGGQVRQDRIERFSAMLHDRNPFSSMTPDARRQMIDEQSQIVERAGRAAEEALMQLLRDDVDRYRAVNMVHDVMAISSDSAPELLTAFEALQLALRTRALNWRSEPSAGA